MTRTPDHDALTPETTTTERPESHSSRHRKDRPAGSLAHPATWLTTAIAVATVGVAGYVATSSGGAQSSVDADARQAQASLSGAVPGLADGAVSSLRESMRQQRTAQGWSQVGRTFEGISALDTSQQSTTLALNAAHQRSEEIAAEREAAEQAAAEQAAAEEAAAEAAAQEAAAEEAAAEEAAAQEAAAEEAAADRVAEQEAASRSEERAEAPAPEPAYEPEPEPEPAYEPEPEPEPAYEPEPEPEPAPAPSGDPRSIARSMLGSYGWSSDQFGCLESLWSKESGWNTYAENASSGAYGIPQSLPGSKMASAGSDWRSNPATQIRWGLGYISGRYGSPCSAWAHSEANNWY